MSALAVAEVRERPPWVQWLELTWALSKKNYQIRYRRATLGVLWAVLQPAVQGIVMAAIVFRVFSVSTIPNFGVYVLIGTVALAMYTASTRFGMTAIIDNAPLVKKVAVPRVIFPIAAVGGTLLVFLGSLIVLMTSGALVGTLSASVVLLIPGTALLVLLVVGVSLLTGAFQVQYRDVGYAVDSFNVLLLYASPVIYVPSQLGKYEWLLSFNPLTGILALLRTAILDRPLDTSTVGWAVLEVFVLLAIAWPLFVARARDFADLV